MVVVLFIKLGETLFRGLLQQHDGQTNQNEPKSKPHFNKSWGRSTYASTCLRSRTPAVLCTLLHVHGMAEILVELNLTDMQITPVQA